MSLSRNQIDKLGERLRDGSHAPEDLLLLHEFRRSFSRPYFEVRRKLLAELQMNVTGRPAKSTASIISKLHRQNIRLSRIQDIAGCRVVVPGIADQNRVIERLKGLFENPRGVDRRIKPSHGYRAYHLIVECQGRLVEIQVRTEMQQAWAMEVESLFDAVDPAIKYGGGPMELQDWLQLRSALIEVRENLELAPPNTPAPILACRAEAEALAQQIERIGSSATALGRWTVEVEAVRSKVREWQTSQRQGPEGTEPCSS